MLHTRGDAHEKKHVCCSCRNSNTAAHPAAGACAQRATASLPFARISNPWDFFTWIVLLRGQSAVASDPRNLSERLQLRRIPGNLSSSWLPLSRIPRSKLLLQGISIPVEHLFHRRSVAGPGMEPLVEWAGLAILLSVFFNAACRHPAITNRIHPKGSRNRGTGLLVLLPYPRRILSIHSTVPERLAEG